MEEAQQQIDIQNLEITPLQDGMTRGVFNIEDAPEFEHLRSWFKTRALQSQRQKKSKTYVASHEGTIVGYTTLSMGLIEEIPGLDNRTSFQFQTLLVGKLYVTPECRGSGIGNVLMDFILDLAQNLDEMVGCIGILLDANTNERTINFYEKYGFEKIGEEDPDDKTIKMFFKLPDEPLTSGNEALVE